jgi:NRPS condensation-like uncharacterized protein
MLKAVPRRLSPVHLAPIDAFFLEDDRDDYPMTFASNLFFRGEFDRLAFEAALSEALDLHPLLHAIIRPAKQNKPCWVTATDLEPVIDWGGPNDDVDLERREAIDLHNETGLRIWVRQGAGRAHLVLQFHHACCDGTGAHRFMGDLLAAYGARRTAPGERSPEVATYDQTLLRQRRMKLADAYVDGSAVANATRAIGQGVHVFGRRISPLSTKGNQDPPTSRQSQRRTYPALVWHKFNKHQHKQLREAAGKLGVTLNDLILAEMFCAMRDWNIEHGSSQKQRLRIMMPSDMRDKQDYMMPAANMTSYNFITRHMRDCRDEAALVHGIWEETGRIKREQRGRLFIDSIMVSKHVPGLMPWLLSNNRCLSTAIVSHMGDPTRRFLATFPRENGKLVCGDVVLEDMIGVSPLRSRTRAAVSIVTLYRELAINVRCDPHSMALGDAHEFLDMLIDRLSARIVNPEPAAALDNELVTA